eukprot:291248_1
MDTNEEELEFNVEFDNAKYAKSLYKFTSIDMWSVIKTWIYNDVNYRKHLQQTKKIMSKMDGAFMMLVSTDAAKRIVKDQMLEFITEETLDIMFNSFDILKN